MFDYVHYDQHKPQLDFGTLLESIPGINDINEITPVFWSEHCLECSPPACYQSCPMFKANEFGRCKRLAYLSIDSIEGFDFPVYHLKFNPWAKLCGGFNTKKSFRNAYSFLQEHNNHSKKVNLLKFFDTPFNFLSPKFRNPFARTVHHNYIKDMIVENNSPLSCGELILAFYSSDNSKLILDSYDIEHTQLTRHMQDVKQGFNLWRVPSEKLCRNYSPVHTLELFPENNQELELSIFYSDFIKFNTASKFFIADSAKKPESKQPAKKVKCVAWDLDNTVWNGIIGEDGLDGIKLKPEVLNVIKHLDQRGILNTICSKNDEELALAGLEKFGIKEYFLYPRINWNPKSSNLLEISKLLNINIDTFAFIDDTNFERLEVSNALSCVRVYKETEAVSLLDKPEFDVPVTEDSIKRRSYYMAEVSRQEVMSESSGGDYEAFIKSCEFVIDISACKDIKDIDRCHELLLRTNQLNASTNRIPYDEFKGFTEDSSKLVLKIKCDDKFGEYGTVGCLIIEKYEESLLCTDFVVSCRVAKKKVESAIIMYLMRAFNLPMDIIYRPSDRNKVLLDEFLSIGGIHDSNKEIVHFTQTSILDSDWAQVNGL